MAERCERLCRNVTQTLSSTAETKAQLPAAQRREGGEEKDRLGYKLTVNYEVASGGLCTLSSDPLCL